MCLPGDRVPLDGACAGVGVAAEGGESFGFATAAGVLRRTGEVVSVENLRKRYIPREGDFVVGVVTQRSSEVYKVDIRAPSAAYLPTMAFNAATRKNRPALEVGSLVYARVQSAHPDLDTELSCIDPETKKAWTTGEVLLGELRGGLSFEVPLSAAQRLLDAECFVLDRLGQDFAYELCVGGNGRIWLLAPGARETVLLLQVIKRSFGMTDAQIEVMIQKMVEIFT
uniref:Ribosomal RNA-processing protein 40 n=1 Tax=Zooxanthella nutricula TaxID=1333877 RepID=A0A7S2QBZ1_9DINO